MIAINTIRREPWYRRAAFEAGLERLGYQQVTAGKPRSRKDLLVLWNLHGGNETLARDWETNGGTVLVCENGYLSKIHKGTYAISVHGHNGSGWFPVLDEDRFTPLGFELKPQRAGGDEILVREQRGIGSRLMASPPCWADRTLLALRKSQPLPVRMIKHPKNDPPVVPIEQDVARAAMLVTWASAMGVRALVEGVHVQYHAPHWVCGMPGQRGFSGTQRLSDDERVQVLHKMSHGQWSPDEISTGEPFARILAALLC